LLGYTRQALHKRQQTTQQNLIEADLVLSEVKQIRKEQPRLGSKKVYSLIKPNLDKHNIKLGRDALFDLLREFGMLVKPLRYKHYSTDSYHHFYKYPNLIKEFSPGVPNQLWVSDITYIEVNGKFMYLFLITDAYSRKIVGWYLSKTYSTQGALKALQMALGENKNIKGLIHHSDRGIQYCCKEYVAILKRKKIKISMTENGDPYENAIAERVNGILKVEYLQKRYDDQITAGREVAKAVYLYNNKRPHLSIEMMMPAYVHQHGVKVKNLWKKQEQKKQRA
jgi:putative transposase